MVTPEVEGKEECLMLKSWSWITLKG